MKQRLMQTSVTV